MSNMACFFCGRGGGLCYCPFLGIYNATKELNCLGCNKYRFRSKLQICQQLNNFWGITRTQYLCVVYNDQVIYQASNKNFFIPSQMRQWWFENLFGGLNKSSLKRQGKTGDIHLCCDNIQQWLPYLVKYQFLHGERIFLADAYFMSTVCFLLSEGLWQLQKPHGLE